MAWVAFVVGIALLIWFVVLQRKYAICQYAYFVRYPIICGGLLFAMPFIAQAASAALSNLLSVNWRASGAVGLFAGLASWAVVYCFRLVWVSIPSTCGISWHKLDHPTPPNLAERILVLLFGTHVRDAQQDDAPNGLVGIRGMIWAALLATPTLVWIIIRQDEPHCYGCAVGTALLGVGVGWAIAIASDHAVVHRSVKWATSDAQPGALSPLNKLFLKMQALLTKFPMYARLEQELLDQHAKASVFAALTAGTYLLFGAVSAPIFPWATKFPTLAFVLILIMVACWIMSFIAFHLDPLRIPGVLLAFVGIALLQAVTDRGARYDAGPQQLADTTTLASDVMARRHARHPDEPMILIGASGGGITAALWTATVLREMERATPDYNISDRVAVVSSVSGGGLGSLFYIDAFGPQGAAGSAPTPRELRDVDVFAARSTLAAVGWGLAYPDLASLFFNVRIDRAWAQEQVWNRLLGSEPVTLASWQPDILSGERPIPVFNVTLQESGQRLLITPVKLYPRTGTDGDEQVRMRYDSIHFYEGRDLSATRAARLSAAFPFVAPQARPDNGLAQPLYHASDGGYYDNSGIVTLIEMTQDYLDAHPDNHANDIIVIEIRAAQDKLMIANSEGDASTGGLINSLSGPLGTLYNARTATQISRTDLELQLARDAWKATHDVNLHHITFVLSEKVPLSWHLTAFEKWFIRNHWPRDASNALNIDQSERYERWLDETDEGQMRENLELSIQQNREAMNQLRTALGLTP